MTTVPALGVAKGSGANTSGRGSYPVPSRKFSTVPVCVTYMHLGCLGQEWLDANGGPQRSLVSCVHGEN